MEPLARIDQHYTAEDAKWPTSLKTAEETATTLSMSSDRLTELALSQHCPHWRIDGGPPMFQVAEVKQWAAQNVVDRFEGGKLPIQLRLMIDAPPAEDAPEAIREIPNLKQIPMAEHPPGVYFLVHEGVIVYVGQSLNPIARVTSHRKDKTFDTVYLVPIPSSQLDDVEGALIRLLKPTLNFSTSSNVKRRLNAPINVGRDKTILEELGLS